MKLFIKTLIYVLILLVVLLTIGFLLGTSIFCVYTHFKSTPLSIQHCPHCNSEMSHHNEFKISKSWLKFICTRCGVVLNDTHISHR